MDKKVPKRATVLRFSLPKSPPASARYVLSLVAVALSTLISTWLRPFSHGTPFLFFYPAVIFSAWVCGLGPGLLATALCALAANYFLLAPANHLSLDVSSVARTVLFAGGFGSICWLAHTARRHLSSIIRVQSELLESALDPVIMRDEEDRVVYWNQGADRLYGWTRSEAQGQRTHDLLKTRFPEPLESILSQLKSTGRWHGELTRSTKDGRTVVVASSWTVYAEQGRYAILEANYDLTARNKAEQEVRQSQESLRTVFNSVYDGIVLHSSDGSIIDVNDRFLTMYGITRQEVETLTVADLSSPSSPIDSLSSLWSRVMAGHSDLFEWRALRPHDRSEFDVEVFLSRIHLAGRDVVLANVRDITERKRVQRHIQELNEALQQRNAELDNERARWQGVVEGMADEVWTCDASGKMSLVNLHTVTPMGLEEFKGRPVEDVLRDVEILDPDGQLRPTEQSPLLRSLRGEIVRGEEIMRHRRTGKTCYRHLSSAPLRDSSGAIIGAVAIVRDITQQKNVEQERQMLQVQLAQSQRMEAIGLMAGSVAHDFNNLLNVISGYSELALRSEPHRTVQSISGIQKATGTAAALTRQLLTLTRKHVLEPQTFDVCEVIRDTASMLPRLLGEDIQVQIDMCSEPCASRMTPGHIEQIVLNLAVNARDAMPSGGILIFRTSISRVDEDASKGLAGLPPGDYVVLTVSDTGEGIPDEVLPRIFEPFFTTKELGKGTGLGLSTVRGIVNQNGGRVFVKTENQRGTTFTIYLPRVHAARSAGTDTSVRTDLQRGSERILLVEDSAALLEMTRAFLEMQGYTVYAASNGVEALELLEKMGGQVDLVFTDVVMPVMNGTELAEQVKRFWPSLRVLFASGYAEEILRKHGADKQHTHVIDKPYSFETLSYTIREVLDHSIPRAS